MLSHIIAYIESNLSALNLAERHYGFVHQYKKETSQISTMFPGEYCTSGEATQINVDAYNGSFYHRLTGPVTSSEDTPDQGCTKLITKSFPIRTVVAVRKTVLSLGNDDAFIEGKVLANMSNILNRKASIKLLRETLKAQFVEIVQGTEITDKYDLWAQEYSGIPFKVPMEYVYAALDYTVNVRGTPACFEMYGCDPDDPSIIDAFCPTLCQRISTASVAAIYACLSVSQIEGIADLVCPACPPEPTLCELIQAASAPEIVDCFTPEIEQAVEDLICAACPSLCDQIDAASAQAIVDCFSPGKEAAVAAIICQTEELTFNNAVIMGLW